MPVNFSVTAGIIRTLSRLLRHLSGPPPPMAAVVEIPLMDAMVDAMVPVDILLAAVEDIPLKTAMADILLTAAMADILVTFTASNILPTTAMAVQADPPLTTTMSPDIMVVAMEDILLVAMEGILQMLAMAPDILVTVTVANILPTTVMTVLTDPSLTTTMVPDILLAAMEGILVVTLEDILPMAAMVLDIPLAAAVADTLLMGAVTKIPPPSVGQADLPSCVILRLSYPWVPTPSKYSHACPSPRRNWAAPLRKTFF